MKQAVRGGSRRGLTLVELIVAFTITIRLLISSDVPLRPKKKDANGMLEIQGVSDLRSCCEMFFRPPSSSVPPSGTRTVVAARWT